MRKDAATLFDFSQKEANAAREIPDVREPETRYDKEDVTHELPGHIPIGTKPQKESPGIFTAPGRFLSGLFSGKPLWAWILAGYFLLVLVVTYPAGLHLADKVIGDGGDNVQFLSFQYLADRQFTSGQFPFGWTNFWRYPVGFDFAISYDSVLLLLLGIGLYRIFADPVVVYNLSCLALLTANCFLSYLFFKKITRNRLLGFLGGFVYGCSFYALARMGGHPNLILTGVFPFFAYAFLILRQHHADARSSALFAAALILVFLASLQYFMILTGWLLFTIPLCFLFYREKTVAAARLLWVRRRHMLFVLFAFSAVFLFFYSKHVGALLTHSLIFPEREIVSVPPINYVIPNKYVRTVSSVTINGTQEWIEYAIFAGFVEIVLFAGFLLLGGTTIRLGYFLLANTVVFLVLSLGESKTTHLLPYEHLFPSMPFRGIVEAGRFSSIMMLYATAASLYFLRMLQNKGAKVAIFIIFVLVLVERLPKNFYLSDTVRNEAFIAAVKKTQTTAVLDLPLFREWWHGNSYDFYSLYYGKPIVNGYIHWLGHTPDTQYMLRKFHKFECSLDPEFVPTAFDTERIIRERDENRALVKELVSYGITTVVVHKDFSLKEHGCIDAVTQMRILIVTPGYSFTNVYEDSKKVIFTIEET